MVIAVKCMKIKWLKLLICFVLCIATIALTFFIDYQNAQAIAGVDDIFIISIVAMLLAAAGVVITDPLGQESLSAGTGRLWSCGKTAVDIIDELYPGMSITMKNWLIVQVAKYLDSQSIDTITVENKITQQMEEIEVVQIQANRQVYDEFGFNDWYREFIINDSVTNEFASNYTDLPVGGTEGHQQWSGYPETPIIDYPYQAIGEAYGYWSLICSPTKIYKLPSGSFTNQGEYQCNLYRLINGAWELQYYVASWSMINIQESNNDIYTNSTLNEVLFSKTTTTATLDSTLVKSKTLDEIKTVTIPSTINIPVNPDIINDITKGKYDAIDVMTNNGAITADIPIGAITDIPVPSMDDAERTWWQDIIGSVTGAVTGAIQGVIDAITDGFADTADPNIEPQLKEFNIGDLFLIFLDVLLACIALIVRACIYLATIVAIVPDSSLLNSGIVSGINFFKNQIIPVINISVWTMFSGMMALVISLSVVKKVRTNH